MDGELFLGVLDRLAAGDDTIAQLASSLGKDQQAVADAVGWAVGSTLVNRVSGADRERLELTAQGRMVVDLRAQADQASGQSGASAVAFSVDFGSASGLDLRSMAAELAQAWTAVQGVQNPEFQAVQKRLLVGDAEREAATNTLEEAFVAGRVDKAELERRTQLAIAAKNRGDLDQAIDGLVDAHGRTVGSADSTVSQWMGLARWVAISVAAVVGLMVLGMMLIVLVAFA